MAAKQNIRKILSKVRVSAWVSLILILILMPIIIMGLFKADTAEAEWFDEGYAYRQRFSFTHNADIADNRAITFTLDTAELITDGVMQADCDDTRFTDINGDELLYDLTGTCDNASTTYEVIFESIINGSNVGYVYYGNPSAANAEIDSTLFSALTPSGGDPGAITDRTGEEQGPGPVGWWKFNEATDNTCSNGTDDTCDDSASRNDGAMTGGTWQHDSLCIEGSCMLFDGSDDVSTVDIANPIDFDSGLISGVTFQAWVKVISDGENNVGEIFDKGATTFCRTDTESSGAVDLECSLDLATTDATLNISSALTLNRWHHIAMSYTDDADDEITVYIDGKSRGTSTDGSGAPAGTDTNNLLIGGSSTANYNGFVDDFKIYNYERSSSQIIQDFSARGSSDTSAVLGASDDKTFLSDGLVGYWDMDESSGNANDSSGNNNTLTNVDTTAFTHSKFFRGAELDGAADYFDAADNASLSLTGDVTLTAWIEPDDVTSHSDHIIGKWDEGDESYQLIKIDDEIRMYIDSSSDYETTDAANLAIDTLYHVVGVYDSVSQTVRLYVNGELEASTTTGTIPSSIGDDAGEFTIGTEDSGGTATNFFDGHIDEARVYNRSLSPIEVKMLYNWSPGPAGHWTFDQNTGTSTAFDSSGNGFDGTMEGTMTNDDWIPGPIGGALDFDGSDDAVDVGNQTEFDMPDGYDFTVTFWARRVDDTTNDTIISKRLSTSSSQAGYLIYLDDSGSSSDLVVTLCDGFDEYNYDSSLSITDTLWHHYAVVFDDDDANNIEVYIDGSIDTNPSTDVLADLGSMSNAVNFTIGAESDNDEVHLGGIDDIRFYNYARTHQQILEDYNARGALAGSRTRSQIGYWNFDENYGQATNDSGTSGVDLIVGDTASVESQDPTWITSSNCILGSCLDFDGTDDRLNENDVRLEIVTDISISMWFNADTIADEETLIYSGETGSETEADNELYFLRFDTTSGNDIEYGHENGTGTDNYNVFDTNISVDTWYHLVVTRDYATSLVSLYLDKRLIGTYTYSNPPTDGGSGEFSIGNADNSGSAVDPFDGTIDELKIYGGALTSYEVMLDYNFNSSVNFGTGVDEASQDLTGGAGDPPIGYWNFDENTDDTCAGGTNDLCDKSGTGNDGALTGPVWDTGKYGSSLNFDGTDDYVQITDDSSLNAGSAFSVSAWIYPESFGDAGDAYIHNIFSDEDTCCNITFTFRIGSQGSSSLNARLGLSDALTDLESTSDLVLNQWQHVVATHDGTDVRFYINGRLDRTQTAFTIVDRSANWRIGKTLNNAREFDGKIDELKYFDYALSPTQVSYQHNRGRPFAWWKFDECQGATAFDHSGNGYNGTITPGASTHTTVGTCGSSSSSEMWDDGDTGKRNNSLDFDGGDDYVDMNDVAAADFNDQSFSVAGWFNRETFTTDDTIISKKNDQLNSSAGFNVWIDDSTDDLRLVVSDGDSTNLHTVDSATSFTSTGWNHFVIVYDDTSSSGSTIYINGQDDNATNTTSGTFTSINDMSNAVDLRIGSEADGGEPYAGELDDIRIYNYALSAAQAKKLVNDDAGVRFGPDTGSP